MEDHSQSPDDLDAAYTLQPSSGSIGEAAKALEDNSDLVDLSSRYLVQEPIGGGGMGEVWRAQDRILQRPVAIKRIKGRLAESREGIARFLTEARAVAAINHPNIVQIHDFGRDDQGYFLVMELVDGESLAERLQKQGPLEPREALELGAVICDALAAAHARGIVHRDIKPANILLNSSGVPKLGDFGVARLEQEEAQQTSAGAMLGTVDYMAPEQRQGAHQADARSDIWSVAATLYQTLTGQVPRVIYPDRLPADARDVLMKGMEDDPARRYQSATEFASALRSINSASPGPVALAPGKCPKCGRVNAADRKFCGACGCSLEAPCLRCGADNGVWERFCGKCGVDLADCVERELAGIEDRKQQALSLRSCYRYGEAISLLEPLAAVRHPRLIGSVAWVEGLLAQLRQEEAELRSARDRLYEAARQAVEEHRYHDATRLLGQIPEAARDERVDALLREASGVDEELRRLAIEINQAVSARQFAGLTVKVERYLALRPTDPRARQLAEALRRRELQQAPVGPPPIMPGRVEPPDRPVPRPPPRPIGAAVRTAGIPWRGYLRYVFSGIAAAACLIALVVFGNYLAGRRDGEVARQGEKQPEPDASRQPTPTPRGGDAASVKKPEPRLQPAETEPKPAKKPEPGDQPSKSESKSDKKLDQSSKPGNPYPKADEKPAPAPQPPKPQPKPSEKPAPTPAPQSAASAPEEKRRKRKPLETEVNTIEAVLVLIPAGDFIMGSADGDEDERPSRSVRIVKPFWLGKHEVTVGQFRKFVEDNRYDAGMEWQSAFPSQTDDHPVVSVSWEDAAAFCKWLSKKEGADYRLPTEAEWEYACRAGTTTKWNCGDDERALSACAWFDGSAGGSTHPVGKLAGNAWGLHDMHGNVWEWCADWYDSGAYRNSSPNDPRGPPIGTQRVARGGSWDYLTIYARSANRYFGSPVKRGRSVGFRLARTE